MEFGLLGLAFFTLLIVLVQGGIYYLRVTVLDYATEVAGRYIMIDDNPGSSVVAPTTASALISDIAASSFGILDKNNISVSLKLCAPVGSTAITNGVVGTGYCTGGFESPKMSTANFDSTNSTFQYVPGVCTGVYYVVGNPGTAGQQIGQVSANGGCTQSCTVNNNNLVNGELEGGTVVYQPGTVSFDLVSGAKFTCSAQQDVVLQVQYIDTSLLNIIATPLSSGTFPFSTITSTLTFQIEPSTT